MTMPAHYTLLVACKNLSGEPDAHVCTVKASIEEFNDGDCYDLAIEAAEDQRYEGNMIAYDHQDMDRLKSAVAQYRGLDLQNNLPAPGPDRQALLLKLIKKAGAMTIDGSPLLSECEISEEEERVVFSWHDPDFSELESRAITFDQLSTVEPMDVFAGAWLVTAPDKTAMELNLYSLEPCL